MPRERAHDRYPATSEERRRRGARAAGTLGAAVLAAGMIAACSSSGSPSGDSPGSASGSGTAGSGTAGSSGQAASAVRSLEAPVAALADPGPKVDGSALKGKTVYYVSINYAVPYFHATEAGLAEALGHVGATVVPCDAQSNPSTAAQCLTQAANQHAAVVVTDSISNSFAQNSYNSLKAQHIPVVKLSTGGQEAATSTDQVAYVYGKDGTNPVAWGKDAADVVAADSNGSANTLYVRFTTSPQLTETVEGAQAETKRVCPKCTVVVKDQTTTDQTQAAQLVSSALLKDPDINYIVGTASIQQGITQALQNTGKTGKVKFVAVTESTAALQAVQQGSSGVDYLILTAPYYSGWAAADQAIRLAAHAAPVQRYDLPIRVLGHDNAQGLSATAGGLASNQWFGGGDFKANLVKLWSAAS